MRKASLRKVVALLLGLAVIGATAACSSGGSSSSAPKSLVIYSADPANVKTYQKLANTFGKSHHVSISIISYPSANFIQQFTPAVNSKSQIDVLLANGQDVRYLQSHQLLGSLGSAIDKSNLIPAAYTPFTINSQQYAVGIGGVSVTAFVYNQAIFDKYGLTVPKTMDDLIADAAKLKGTGIAPVSVPGGNVYLWPIWMMQMLQQTTKNTPTQTTFNTLSSGKPSFDSANYTDALSEMAKLGSGDVFANGWAGLQEPAADSLFTSGKAAMFFGGSWDISTIAEQAPSSMNIKAFAFPNFVPGVKSTAFGGASIAAGVYGKIDPSHKALATQLVQYLASADSDKQLITGNTAISLPTVKSVKSSSSSALQTQLVNEFLPTESTFLDWYWPKQVVAVYQQEMAGVVSGSKTASSVSQDVDTAFQTAKSAGYKFN